MSDNTTIARPYAKAIFEYAFAANALTVWSAILNNLAQAVLEPQATEFLGNPANDAKQQSQLLQALFVGNKLIKDQHAVNNLIELLTHNKRLMVLPDIYAQYELLRAEQEKTLDVHVNCFAPLTSAQQKQLTETLSKRLQRQVSLKLTIEESLLGGVVIRAGDLVIDGSVRGKLNKLGASLAA